MAAEIERRETGRANMTRRAWAAALLSCAVARKCRADGPRTEKTPSADTDRDVRRIADKVKNAGIGIAHRTDSSHYVAVGNGSTEFRAACLRICEGLRAEYFAHFRRKGFVADPSGRRLVVVALADADSYDRFVGEAKSQFQGGHYEPITQEAILFDPCPPPGTPGRQVDDRSGRIAHEAMHQLTFDSGLLSGTSDYPSWICEGLAMYGEVIGPAGRPAIGRCDATRLDRYWTNTRREGGRIEWQELFSGDDWLFGETALEKINSRLDQSWLFTHFLMSSGTMLPRLRRYLEATRARADSKSRLEDIRAHLGNPPSLAASALSHARHLASRA